MGLGKLGKYDRVDVLGHGASGIVYLAWDTLLKKQVALKEVDVQAGDMSRFLEEARVMDRLSHPNIVRVNGVDVIDNHVVIDMEYVKGRNLQELLREEARLPVDRALDIAIQVLDALDYAHQMRTVHRDIKPANILIDRQGQVKLVDFGLAEILSTNSYAGGAGTYAYMAPEDFDEVRHSDHQSDVWSVGVTLYEMLTGLRPFNVAKAKDPFAWRRTLLEEEPAPLALPGVDPDDPVLLGLREVIGRALARAKEQRYQSAGEFRDDLRALVHGDAPANAQALPTAVLPITPMRQPTVAPFAPPPAVAGQTLQLMVEEAAPLPIVVTEEQSQSSRRRRARPVLPARVVVDPPAIFFGHLRKGETRQVRVKVRFEGGEGKMNGRVVSAPPWVTVSQNGFDRRKQTLTFTGVSERVWETGEFQEAVKLETSAGEVTIPVGLHVLPARPSFAQVAVWLIPAFVCGLLPALTVAWGVQQFASVSMHSSLVPSAALETCLLSAMLLIAVSAADLGILERIACGLLAAVMALVFGARIQGMPFSSTFTIAVTGFPVGLCLMAELATHRYWKFWVAITAALGILVSASFFLILQGRA